MAAVLVLPARPLKLRSFGSSSFLLMNNNNNFIVLLLSCAAAPYENTSFLLPHVSTKRIEFYQALILISCNCSACHVLQHLNVASYEVQSLVQVLT
jgi:hypothetical protein